jgi:uncharacterized RDD family membrane protein YckC
LTKKRRPPRRESAGKGRRKPRRRELVGEGLALRIPAGLIDMVIVMMLWWTFMWAATKLGPIAPQVRFMATLVFLLYFVILEILWQTTIGKRVFGLKVVTLTGEPPDAMQHLLRGATRLPEALFVLPYVISVWISPRSQRIGDRLTDCLVVRERSR